jgi:hypothetical protein
VALGQAQPHPLKFIQNILLLFKFAGTLPFMGH